MPNKFDSSDDPVYAVAGILSAQANPKMNRLLHRSLTGRRITMTVVIELEDAQSEKIILERIAKTKNIVDLII